METSEEFDAALPDLAQHLIRDAREFAEQVVAPHAEKWERERAWPVETLRHACVEPRLAAVEVPTDRGGLGLPFRARVRVAEELAKVDFGFAFALINHHNAAVRLAEAGTATAAEQFLPRLLSGELIGCTAMSESEAGSDFAAITTSAKSVPGGWLLNGAKRWIGNAAGADLFLTFAQTDANARGKGIACFLVDASSPGFERHKPEPLLGVHAAGIGGFALHDYFAPEEHLLYSPGEGFRLAMASVNKARTHVAAMAAGVLCTSLRQATDFAQERNAFGQPLLKHQGLRWTLVDVATTHEALQLLTYRAANLIDHKHDAQRAAAMAKKFAGDHGPAAVLTCMQTLGARGLLQSTGFHRRLAAAKAMCFADGTTEMMNERIGKFLGRSS
jgi:acrylyl-CoA reductase (NADPH)